METLEQTIKIDANKARRSLILFKFSKHTQKHVKLAMACKNKSQTGIGRTGPGGGRNPPDLHNAGSSGTVGM